MKVAQVKGGAISAARQERLAPGGVPRWIHLYDNGGKTVDRYTCVFTGRYTHKTGRAHWYLGMSGAPFHPQGFGQHGESRTQIDYPSYGHLGKKVTWENLPADVQRCIWQTYADLWDIQAPKVAQPSRRT